MRVSRRAKPTKEQILQGRVAHWPEDDLCPLCGRKMVVGSSVNDHHLIPRMYGGTQKYSVHKVCHSKIHSVFSEAELAYVYNSFEKLRSHPEIIKFLKWVRKQDSEFMTKHHRPRA